MRVTYDPAADALYIRIAETTIDHSNAATDDAGVIFDFDAAGVVVGVELLDVSERLSEAKAEESERAA